VTQKRDVYYKIIAPVNVYELNLLIFVFFLNAPNAQWTKERRLYWQTHTSCLAYFNSQ